MYYEQLAKQLFANLAYPQSMRTVMSGISAWHDFCDLPMEKKNLFLFPEDQGTWEPGYKRRYKSAGREDKEYFHFHGDYLAMLTKYGLTEKVATDPVLRALYQLVGDIRHETEKLVDIIAADLEQFVPGVIADVEASRDLMTLRFIHYDPQDSVTEVLAAPHFDRCGFSFHLYENMPGLQHLDWNHQWVDSPIDPTNTVLFTSYQLQKASQDKLQNTWHRVVRRQDVSTVGDRYSLVAFVPFRLTPTYSFDARSQDMTPGYVK